MDLHPNQVSMEVVNGSVNTINPFLSEMGIVSAVGVRDTNYPTTSSNSDNNQKQQYNNLEHHLPGSSRINNHMEKKAPTTSRTEPRMMMSEVEEDEALFVASPSVLVAMVSMFCSLLAALTYAICMYVKVKALTQRLTIYEGHATSAKKTFYPYYARNYITQPQQASVGYGRIVDFVGGHSK